MVFKWSSYRSLYIQVIHLAFLSTLLITALFRAGLEMWRSSPLSPDHHASAYNARMAGKSAHPSVLMNDYYLPFVRVTAHGKISMNRGAHSTSDWPAGSEIERNARWQTVRGLECLPAVRAEDDKPSHRRSRRRGHSPTDKDGSGGIIARPSGRQFRRGDGPGSRPSAWS